MKKYTFLLLINFIYLTGFTQTTRSLVDEVSLDSLVKTVRAFSGEDSTLVNDTLVRIQHRVSKKGNNLAADYLVDRLTALGLKVETIDYRSGGRNVVGTLLGKTNPDSVFFISAHYDAVADYCADDNASGSATVLEAARIMSKYCFHNTIKFAFWDEEELGLIGSKYYADSAIARGDFISGVLNMDMMGYDGDSNKVFDIHTNSDPENQLLKDTVLFILDTLNIDLVPNVINPGTTRSDHAAFWKHRYPAVFCGESFIGGDPNPAYHSSKDRIDLFDLNYYHKLAQLAIGVTVELTGVIPTSVETESISACHAYTYKDTTFYTSTEYSDSLHTDMGCDSIYLLDLTILPVYTTIDSITTCYKYVYRDQDYFTSGIYSDTLISRNGCDSIYTMALTILPIRYHTDTIKVCEFYRYRNQVFTLSGIYRDTLDARNGCDSVYTMVLTVWPLTHVVDTISVCGAYNYRNKVFTNSGLYHDTLTDRNGCDSFYSFDLTVRPLSRYADRVHVCDMYVYRSDTFYNSGVYYDTLSASNGCDSIYSFDLTITKINDSIYRQGNDLIALDSSAYYQWVRCSGENRIPMHNESNRNFRIPLDDFYAVIINKGQCKDTSDCLLALLSDVKSIEKPSFVVYPNPTTGVVDIVFNQYNENANLLVYTSTGRLVIEQRTNGVSRLQLSLPDQLGVYFIHVETENGSSTKRILKIED